MPEPSSAASSRVIYWSRVHLAMLLVNVIAFGLVFVFWDEHTLAMFVGWCLSWLYAVTWTGLQEARRDDA